MSKLDYLDDHPDIIGGYDDEFITKKLVMFKKAIVKIEELLYCGSYSYEYMYPERYLLYFNLVLELFYLKQCINHCKISHIKEVLIVMCT